MLAASTTGKLIFGTCNNMGVKQPISKSVFVGIIVAVLTVAAIFSYMAYARGSAGGNVDVQANIPKSPVSSPADPGALHDLNWGKDAGGAKTHP